MVVVARSVITLYKPHKTANAVPRWLAKRVALLVKCRELVAPPAVGPMVIPPRCRRHRRTHANTDRRHDQTAAQSRVVLRYNAIIHR